MPLTVQLNEWIRSGDRVIWGQANSEPQTLTKALIEQRHTIGGIKAFVGISTSTTLESRPMDGIEFESYCGAGTNRDLIKAGVMDVFPSNYSQIPHHIQSGRLPVDVLLLQVSPPDEMGRYSYGFSNDYLLAAKSVARVVLAEVNQRTPWTIGQTHLTRDDFDLLIESEFSCALPASEVAGAFNEVEERIAINVSELVEDGATLQIGIGRLPELILRKLNKHRNLGLHTGVAGDAVAELAEVGALNNSEKALDRGVAIAGFLMGSQRISSHVHKNPTLQLRGTEYTHDPKVLASQTKFTAVNSAIEVDLTGQINAEVVGTSYVGAVGGGAEFLRAANLSKGGIPIVALASTAAGKSRIVGRLQGPVSTARSDAGVIVTEYGYADLRGLSLRKRIEKMIEIAHPMERHSLELQAESLLANGLHHKSTH